MILRHMKRYYEKSDLNWRCNSWDIREFLQILWDPDIDSSGQNYSKMSRHEWIHFMADCAEFEGRTNAFAMFKYAIQFANTANSLPNLDFDNRYVGTTNFQGIFGICMTHKSLLSTGTSDLYTWHILSLYFNFLLCANLMTNLEFPNEFAAIAYEFLFLNITIALRMHLWDIQIWCCMLWSTRMQVWLPEDVAAKSESVHAL